MWTQEEALELCRAIENISPQFGAHVALTGGLLYKDGPRKDCDLVLYRIRQHDVIDAVGLMKALAAVGLTEVTDAYVSSSGDDDWCLKARWRGKPVDIFFPEAGAVDWETWADVSPAADPLDDIPC
jgi:hypothetical protein